ncbi:unnamed protein product [Arabidopsis lyrata]|uniref:F-box/kelch-repeat protein At1g64840 n=1 Tax=Arabidopsis lyrata subsp. lyrata TaxID=81972 RepID=UPI000A29E72D|nr:F-box/kelch-repeat protein At1g64840 [Arabidopsis lyrata subsp. lyrata]XP_020884028.1 F-box/kelch-repeat protein At1g64840 [Arabidopsis lyrata subsp. lyrata]CAH8263655.1 unnamed protein product [Arabidopsis lyrata]|eukprot:XP_020884027.1 F-box/kelch-repeat protein At1g64840 [Arabidopsis lyrata subsp. lyrata]
MAEPEIEKMTSSVSKLQLSPPPSVRKEKTFSMPDWSLLPEELLNLISKHLEDYCFDVVHARSVCTLWRSIFPFPASLLRPSYSLPSLTKFPYESKDLCTLEKIPLFLFRVRAPHADASEYFLGGIGRDDDDHIELPSPLQCSVKVKIPDSDPTLINTLDCQVLSLGHQYRMIGCNPKYYKGVAFLPLNKFGGGEEFVVLLNYTKTLLVLRSIEMRWMLLEIPSYGSCSDLITFRGRFYAAFSNHDIFAIDPYSLEATPLMPSEALLDCGSVNDLVPSGNDELFLVEKIIPRTGVIYLYRLTLRLSRLDEEAGKWVEVSEIGDRLLVIGNLGNVCCSAKELPDGCGLTGNSIVFTHGRKVTYSYKYGVHTGREEDDLNCWRYSRDKCVTILSTSPVVALRVETAKP